MVMVYILFCKYQNLILLNIELNNLIFKPSLFSWTIKGEQRPVSTKSKDIESWALFISFTK